MNRHHVFLGANCKGDRRPYALWWGSGDGVPLMIIMAAGRGQTTLCSVVELGYGALIQLKRVFVL